MMMKHCKKILGYFTFVILVSVLFVQNVDARTEIKCSEKANGELLDMFNFNLQLSDDRKWLEISYYPPERKYRDITFTVVGVNTFKATTDRQGNVLLEDNGNDEANLNRYINAACSAHFGSWPCSADTSAYRKFSAGQVYTYPVVFYDPTNDGEQMMSLKIRANEQIDGCAADDDVYIYLGFSYYGESSGGSFNYDGGTSSIVTTTNALNCSNYAASFSPDSFNYKFCQAKDLARQDGSNYFEDEFTPTYKKFSSSAISDFKCNTKICNSSTDSNCVPIEPRTSSDPEDPDGYYVNKSYMYASGKEVAYTSSYLFHYNPGSTPASQDISCSKECEEAVTVEYGPPVAAEGGMCFEYKVKVTSRVVCKVDADIPPVPQNYNYCTPTPYCLWRGIEVHTEGGPNDDFDNCVKECDGGKYTDKCSKKCYNEVYANANSSKKTANSLLLTYEPRQLAGATDSYTIADCKRNSQNYDYTYTTIYNAIYKLAYDKAYNDNVANGQSEADADNRAKQTAQAEADAKAVNLNRRSATGVARVNPPATMTTPNNGCYQRVSSKLQWKGVTNSTYGRWYLESSHKYYTTYVVDTEGSDAGIYRNTKNGLCQDSCSWINCGSSGYLNPEDIAYDFAFNTEQYLEAKSKCKAAASCNTSTAEFTISTDYNTRKNPDDYIKIEFPYSSASPSESEKDKLNSHESGYAVGVDKGTAGAANTTLLNYDEYSNYNCYGRSLDDEITYKAEWSFPGSWVNAKSFKTIYDESKVTTSYIAYPKQFCLPDDAGIVNPLWWNYYNKMVFEAAKAEATAAGTTYDTSLDNSYADNLCKISTSSNTVKTIDTSVSENYISENYVDRWNILAQTTNFGNYGWNIDISCFYATNTYTPPTCVGDDCGPCVGDDCNKKECGDPGYRIRSVDLADVFPDEEGTPSSDVTKPSRGVEKTPWNWTSNSATRDPASVYVIKPSEYLEYIQEENQSSGTAQVDGTGIDINYYSDDNIDYEFNLTTILLRDMRNRNNNFAYNTFEDNASNGSVTKNVIYFYQSKLFRDGGPLASAVVKMPSVSALKCNNLKNSNECQTEFGE